MNLHVFTTGRGTPYGLAAVPVIKVATRTDLARRWNDLMDINAGKIADGQATIEELGWEMFHFMLDVASGKKKTFAEQWKLHNAIALFNTFIDSIFPNKFFNISLISIFVLFFNSSKNLIDSFSTYFVMSIYNNIYH